MDFTTLLKILLEKTMNNEQTQSKAFWAVWGLVLTAILLFGGASIIAAVSQLIVAAKP